MLFSSHTFLFLFLPVVLVAYLWLERRASIVPALAWLVLASLVFYAWWKPAYLFLLIGSIGVNYLIGERIRAAHGAPEAGAEPVSARAWLWLGVGANLALIGYYKYAGFFIENLNALSGGDWVVQAVLLPLGISFFTFQQIAYLVDTARGEVRHSGPLNYALFVSFFPQLIAGPIVHHKEMLSQFLTRRTRAQVAPDILVGLSIFAVGLFKKIIVADGVASYSDSVFAAAMAGEQIDLLYAWVGALAYSVQLYFDFSGYSDMAIGLALLFGIRLPLNFNSPYKAQNIIDFWRRWHMTLSRFLRDYLYFPLGGNRGSSWSTYRNLMIVMVLGGLWHGAGWTFVLWGTLHGVYLLVNHGWRHWRARRGLQDVTPGVTYRLASWALTFLAVLVGWVYFRADSLASAHTILAGMAGLNGVVLPEHWPGQWPQLAALAERLGVVFTTSGSLGPMFTPVQDILSLIVGDWQERPVGSVTALVTLVLPMLGMFLLPNTHQLFATAAQRSTGGVAGQIRAPRTSPQLQLQSMAPIGLIDRIAWQPTYGWVILIAFIAAYAAFGGGGAVSFLYFNF